MCVQRTAVIEAKHTIEALQQVEKDKIAELEEQRKNNRLTHFKGTCILYICLNMCFHRTFTHVFRLHFMLNTLCLYVHMLCRVLYIVMLCPPCTWHADIAGICTCVCSCTLHVRIFHLSCVCTLQSNCSCQRLTRHI